MAGSMGPKLIAEFVGTFLLIFTVGCNVLSQNAVWGAVSIGCVLMVSIYAFGCVSGANFNPAVSFALALLTAMGHRPKEEVADQDRFKWGTFLTYSVVQIIAGLAAGFAYTVLFWDSFNLAPAKEFGWINAGLAEFFYTFMLVFVVLNVAASRAAAESHGEFYGLAIGFVVIAGAYGAGAVSGGCFNPAVAIGIDAASANIGFGWCILYVVFELLGAAFACFFFKLVRPEEFRAPSDRERQMGSKLASEFIGTFMLVLTVGLNVLGASPAGAFSIAASLMCMIYALGDVSGAHFNPAVTCALLGAGKVKAGEAVLYIVAQIIGGIAAAMTYVLIYVGRSFPLAGDSTLNMGRGWQIAMAELVFTFTLCTVVLCVAASDVNTVKQFFGLAIGSCVTVGGLAIGGISGGSLNPAVSIAIASGASVSGKYTVLSQLFRAMLYSLIEILAGFMAAAVYKMTHGAIPAPTLPPSEKQTL
jgi:aquaporin Z